VEAGRHPSSVAALALEIGLAVNLVPYVVAAGDWPP
jgi:hypothetical protein